MNIKVMSFNIQHGFDYKRKDRIDLSLTADAIRQCNADIVGINEVRGEGADPDYTDQTKAIADQLGYYYYFGPSITFPGRGSYGNAIVSRYPIQCAEVITIPDPEVKDEKTYYETRSILKAEFNVTDGFTVYISHFGLARSECRNAVATLLEALKIQEKPCVFMGDLNMSPDDDLLAPVFDQLCDTSVLFKEPLLSFPSDKPQVKIDYIFVSKGVKVLSADIPAIVVSDHRPHTAELDL